MIAPLPLSEFYRHVPDLHILLNTVTAPAVANSPASWIPICLPRFNSSGFLYAYVAHPSPETAEARSPASPMPPSGTQTQPAPVQDASQSEELNNASSANVAPKSSQAPTSPTTSTSHSTTSSSVNSSQKHEEHGLTLVCVSGGGGSDFETVRSWCEQALSTLQSSGLISALFKSSYGSEYGAETLGIPGLRHFVYKSRAHVQVTHPVWGERYGEEVDRRR